MNVDLMGSSFNIMGIVAGAENTFLTEIGCASRWEKAIRST